MCLDLRKQLADEKILNFKCNSFFASRVDLYYTDYVDKGFRQKLKW